MLQCSIDGIIGNFSSAGEVNAALQQLLEVLV